MLTDAGAVLASVAGAHAAVAVLASALLPGAAAVAVAPWAAMLGGGLVAGSAAAVGVATACGLPPEWTDRLPGWLPTAGRAAGVALAGLTGSGAALLVAALVLRFDDLATAYRTIAPDAGAGLGLSLLALGYLPNAVVAATSWLLGPGVLVGTATASPLATYGGERSSFPLLAAFPAAPAPAWAATIFVVPVAVGVLTGLRCSRRGPGPRVPAAIGASLLTALGVGVLGVAAGGRLASGPFDPVRLPVELLMPSVLLLVGVPAVLVAWFRRVRKAPHVEAPGPDPSSDGISGSGPDEEARSAADADDTVDAPATAEATTEASDAAVPDAAVPDAAVPMRQSRCGRGRAMPGSRRCGRRRGRGRGWGRSRGGGPTPRRSRHGRPIPRPAMSRSRRRHRSAIRHHIRTYRHRIRQRSVERRRDRGRPRCAGSVRGRHRHPRPHHHPACPPLPPQRVGTGRSSTLVRPPSSRTGSHPARPTRSEHRGTGPGRRTVHAAHRR